MKKVRLLLTVTVVLVLLLALSSCCTNSAKGVFKKVNTAMSKLDSYKSETTVTVSVNMSGQAVAISGNVSQVMYKTRSKDCYVYSEQNTRTTAAGNVTAATRIMAYNDGYAFSYSSTGASVQSLCSPLSRKDFLEYYQYNASGFDTRDIYDCESRTLTQNENGAWEIRFSGYSDEAINAYLATLGFDVDTLDNKAVDMEVTLKANSKFYATVMSTKVIFKNDDSTTSPKIESTVYYSAYDEVVPDTSELNTAYYQKVEDIRLIDGLQYMISDLQSKKSGRFTHKVTQTSGSSTYTEDNIVRFGTTAGDFYYEIDAKINGEKRTITYRDGKKTTEKSDKTDTVKQSEAEARTFINGLINSASYNAMYVKDIVKLKDGRYKVTLEITNVKAYQDLITSAGGAYAGAEQTVYFTLKRKKIDKIESVTTISHSRGDIVIKSEIDVS